MKYGQIAESKAINTTIYDCFQFLTEPEVLKFVKRFKEQPHNESQVMHTFRELILGAFLSQNQYNIEYEFAIDSKTPDWCVLDDHSEPRCIIELLNFNIDAETKGEMIRQKQQKGIWSGFVNSNIDRLYTKISKKVTKYKTLVRKHDLSFVISLFGEFTAFLEEYEINECLFEEGTGLFHLYPEMSGLLYFEEYSGNYFFRYTINPNATITINFNDGSLY